MQKEIEKYVKVRKMPRNVKRGKNVPATPQRSKLFKKAPKSNSAIKHARRNRGIQ